jgi:AbrB family looped-hinge helix DNA binding protein
MTTTVTVKGQVTLPKGVRDAAGIKPGDRVSVRVRPEGGVVVERERDEPVDAAAVETAKRRIDRAVDDLHRRGIKPNVTADESMRLTRGDTCM